MDNPVVCDLRFNVIQNVYSVRCSGRRHLRNYWQLYIRGYELVGDAVPLEKSISLDVVTDFEYIKGGFDVLKICYVISIKMNKPKYKIYANQS